LFYPVVVLHFSQVIGKEPGKFPMVHFWPCFRPTILESYFEVFVPGVERALLDIGFRDETGEFFFNIADAVVDCLGRALREHLDGAVRQISDKAGQLAAAGYVICGKAETDALNAPCENYVFCCLAHCALYINSKRPSIQAGIDENQFKVH
jgi:hypothetical protein